jgi:hypothetical protein
MAKGKVDGALLIVVVGIFAGPGCSTGVISHPDAAAAVDTGIDRGMSEEPDTGTDAAPEDLVACRVALNDPLNPCKSKEVDQEAQGTAFPISYSCYSGGYLYQSREASHVWDCTYQNGELVAWDRIESTSLCDGHASAVVADSFSKGQLMNCLITDGGEWTWLLGFDPGPPEVAVQLATDPTRSTSKISVGLGFFLTGSEIAGSDLTFRYWYTADAPGVLPQTTSCDGDNGVSCDFANISIVPVTPPRPMADTYAELSFPILGTMSTGFNFTMSFSIVRSDGASYNQSNDYSYTGTTQSMPSQKITAYIKGALVYGTEP